jgi:hypothetical protein
MINKYEFTGEVKVVLGITLKQIRRLSDKEFGGWIEEEKNLSQSGNAWVYGNAQVYGDAWVYGNAQVSGNAQVYGDARVYGDAWVYGNAQVYGDARVYGDAWVYGNAQVYGDARVSGNAWVYGDARVSGNAWVYGNARVYGNAQLKFVAGFKFGITVTPQNISVGCKLWTHAQFKALAYRDVSEHATLSEYRMMRTLILLLMKSVKK